MALSTATQPFHSRLPQEFSPVRVIFGAAVMGGANAVAAGLFTTVSPLGGAIYGVSFFLGHCLIRWVSDPIDYSPDNIIFRTAQIALSMFGGIGTGLFTTSAFGFPICFATAITLTTASIGVAIATILALGGCLCSSAVVSGFALANPTGTTTRV